MFYHLFQRIRCAFGKSQMKQMGHNHGQSERQERVDGQADRQTHTMMTSSNGNISASLALCAGNSPVTGEFPAQRPATRSFDVFFDLRLNQ